MAADSGSNFIFSLPRTDVRKSLECGLMMDTTMQMNNRHMLHTRTGTILNWNSFTVLTHVYISNFNPYILRRLLYLFNA